MSEYQVLCDLIRQQFASVVWTHKIQEKQADIYAKRYSWLEIINIIMAASTSCGIIALIFKDDSLILKITTAIISFATLAISAYYKSFNPSFKAKENKDAANNLIGVRNELLTMIADCHLQEKPAKEIKNIFDGLTGRLNKLYLELPATTVKAVKKAEESLKNDEYSFSDDEIDCFLVKSLKGKVK